MMTPLHDMTIMAPQMMGYCSFFGVAGWLISMATLLIAIGAIVYLLTKRPATSVHHEFSQQ